LVEALLKDALPRDKLEAQSVLDHGEAPAGEIGDARQPAGDIFAGSRWAVGESLQERSRRLQAANRNDADARRIYGDALNRANDRSRDAIAKAR